MKFCDELQDLQGPAKRPSLPPLRHPLGGLGYHRFALSLRDVEEPLAARGVLVSPETIRVWSMRFGPQMAARIRRDRPACSDKWRLDEMVMRIGGETHWLWRAIDARGDVLDVLIRHRRDARTAGKFRKN